MSEQLEVSPTPIREAIRKLSTEHAIEIMGNRRVIVPSLSLERFKELLYLRIAVETHAAARALPFVSGLMIEELVRQDAEMEQAIKTDDFAALTVLNQNFHRYLYTANPHQAAMPMIESIWLQLGPSQRQLIRKVKANYVVDRHQEVIRALVDRDEAALVKGIKNDIVDGAGPLFNTEFLSKAG